MRWFDTLRMRVRSLVLRHHIERELDAELRFHIEQQTEENLRAGMSAETARLAALRTTGSVMRIKEEYRESLGLRLLDQLRQDVRYAFRSFMRTPGFTFVAVLTLALGVGANTAIFSVIDTLLLRRPPFEHLDRLVSIQERNRQKIPFDIDPSPARFLDWRTQARSFEYLAAWRNWYFTFGTAGQSAPESIRGVRISPDFFSMLVVHPSLGRTFVPGEEQPGHDRVVLLSYGFWTGRLGADPAAIGRTVLIDGLPFAVVGVLPRDFQFLQPDLDIWMPLTVDAGFHDRESHSVMVFARLAPGVSLNQAQADMDAIENELGKAYPDTDAGWTARVERLYPPPEIRALQPALLVLLGASGLVLLIACANMANLLIARAIARRQEIAIRAALGASRARLVRQTLTESVMLAVVSGTVGAAIAYQGVRWLVPLLPRAGTNKGPSAFRAITPALDSRMLAFSLAVAILTGIAFGLLPAFQAARPASLRFRDASPERSRMRRALMVTELALSTVLLIGAGLMLESFWRLQHVDPGFRADHLLTMQVWLPRTRYPAATDIRGFYDEVIRRINGVPAVTGAAAISYRPFLSMGSGERVDIEGRPPTRLGEQPAVEFRVVTPRFVGVLGQPLVEGRDFTEADGANADGVAIVNEAMARRYWPDRHAMGRRLRLVFHPSTVPWEMNAVPRWLTIVGVARDIKGLAPNDRDQSQVYISSLQFPSGFMFLVVRTATPSLAALSAIQSAIRSVDPDQPVSDVQTMDDAIAASVPRFNVELLGVFALIALYLSAVGVYGVTSYVVSWRTHEIGVRMALGAQASGVLRMIVRETLAVGTTSVGVGVLVALVVTRAMAGLLYGVATTDGLIYLSATFVLMLVALLAAYVPARRAACVDPLIALRYE
jgi:predicted permease